MRNKLELALGSIFIVIIIISTSNIVVKLCYAIGEALAKALPR